MRPSCAGVVNFSRFRGRKKSVILSCVQNDRFLSFGLLDLDAAFGEFLDHEIEVGGDVDGLAGGLDGVGDVF
jgi:hypothetical protein